eukprot:1161772-Pelagomonas_calceolata.AAC.1
MALCSRQRHSFGLTGAEGAVDGTLLPYSHSATSQLCDFISFQQDHRHAARSQAFCTYTGTLQCHRQFTTVTGTWQCHRHSEMSQALCHFHRHSEMSQTLRHFHRHSGMSQAPCHFHRHSAMSQALCHFHRHSAISQTLCHFHSTEQLHRRSTLSQALGNALSDVTSAVPLRPTASSVSYAT